MNKEINNIPIEQKVVKLLSKHNLTISTAESCTGGLIASTIINVSGASKVIKESYITYSNEAKIKILNVHPETLDKFSVYSKEVAEEMVRGLYNISKANVCISVTGTTEGENGEQEGSCDASIYLNLENSSKIINFYYYTKGSRNEIRMAQTNHILRVLLENLHHYFHE